MPKKRRQTPARKPPEFTVPIKLWVNPEMFKELEAMAELRDWSVPQVIRRAVREALQKKLV